MSIQSITHLPGHPEQSSVYVDRGMKLRSGTLVSRAPAQKKRKQMSAIKELPPKMLLQVLQPNLVPIPEEQKEEIFQQVSIDLSDKKEAVVQSVTGKILLNSETLQGKSNHEIQDIFNQLKGDIFALSKEQQLEFEQSSKNVLSLDIKNTSLTLNQMRRICELFPHIRKLNLENLYFFDNAMLREVSTLEHLEDLSLNSCHYVSVTGIEFLKKLHKLKRLSLQNCKMIGELLGCLRALLLEELDVSGNRLDDQSLLEIGKLTTLKKLNLENMYFADTLTELGYTHLKNLPLLEELNLKNRKITPSLFQQIGSFSSVRSLSIGSGDLLITSTLLSSLQENFLSLEKLHITTFRLFDTALEPLFYCRSLKVLELNVGVEINFKNILAQLQQNCIRVDLL